MRLDIRCSFLSVCAILRTRFSNGGQRLGTVGAQQSVSFLGPVIRLSLYVSCIRACPASFLAPPVDVVQLQKQMFCLAAAVALSATSCYHFLAQERSSLLLFLVDFLPVKSRPLPAACERSLVIGVIVSGVLLDYTLLAVCSETLPLATVKAESCSRQQTAALGTLFFHALIIALLRLTSTYTSSCVRPAGL